MGREAGGFIKINHSKKYENQISYSEFMVIVIVIVIVSAVVRFGLREGEHGRHP